MLNKRAQILFDEQTYRTLEEIAQKKGGSVGELVRVAVKKTYKTKSKTRKPKTLAQAAKGTFGAWKFSSKDNDLSVSPLSDFWSEPDKVF